MPGAGPVEIRGTLNVAAIEARLKRSIAPTMLRAAQIAADTGAAYLRDRVRVSKNFGGRIRHRNAATGKGYPGKTLYERRASRAKTPAKSAEYPRRRTGSLLASIDAAKAVVHYNVYSVRFGVIKNVRKGAMLVRSLRWGKKSTRRKTLSSQITKTSNITNSIFMVS